VQFKWLIGVFFVPILLDIAVLQAAPAILPLKDVRAGQRGFGRTVFSGTRVEEFQVEILGVLENVAPRQSIILARLSGGPLAKTGVMQGMSGSPVYINGKLIGAVALAFPYATDPIAGIRPIEEMLRVESEGAPAARTVARAGGAGSNARLEEIATPVSFSGFTQATLEHFGSQLRELGMDPRQGVSGGGQPSEKLGNPKQLEPGSMISVQLLSGDYSVGADGTVTAIDGDRVYAFGHRFLAAGPTEMPFARAEVLALLPNLNASFKISTAREWMGSITADRSAAISGVTGRLPSMAPVEIRVRRNTYRMRMVQDKVMTPLVTQMAVFSSIDTTERSLGPSALTVRGRLDFEGGSVRLENVYSSDVSTPALAAMGVASPLAYALSSGFDAMKLKGIAIDIGTVNRRDTLQIAGLSAPRQVRPGEEVELSVTLSGENSAETVKTVRYRVPIGAQAGTLTFTVNDATSMNFLELGPALATPPRSAGQVLEVLNSMRSNNSAYLRVWRAEASYAVEGRDLPGLPPSVAMVLAKTPSFSGAGMANIRGSKLAEIAIPAGDFVVIGSKTVQVEIKE
jgi:hypothetical protein